MKTLSAPATTVSRRHWAEFGRLIQVDFTIPSPFTLRVSDVYRQALGQQWQAMIADWGTLEATLNTVDLGGRPATGDLGLINNVPVEGTGKARLSDLIRTPGNTTGTYEWAFAKATVYQLLDPSHGAGDVVPLGVYYLEDPTEIDERILRVRMSDLSLALEDKLRITRITKALFPLADPDAIGQEIPITIGSLTRVPARAVVSGGQSTLAAVVAAGSAVAALPVTETTRFADSGTVQVDDEQFTYVGKTPSALSITARGVAGTVAVGHAAGAAVWEVRSGQKAYRYVIGRNWGAYKVKRVSAVYAGDVLQPQATVDLDDTTLVPGQSFVVVNFPALPVLKRQVVLEVDDALAVGDNIGLVASTKTTSTTTSTSPTTTQTSSAPAQATNLPASASTFIEPFPFTASIPISVPSAPVSGITSVSRAMTFRITEFSGASTSWSIRRADGTVVMQGSGPPALGSFTMQWSTGTTYGGDTLLFAAAGPKVGGRFSITVDLYQLTVNGAVTITGTSSSTSLVTEVTTTKTGSAFRSGALALSGNSTADVVIGEVTCDLEGLQDDGAGTISGTPFALLENPADVVKLIHLAGYPGVTTADLGTTWATTRARLVTLDYRWAALLGFRPYSELRRRLSDQARSVLYVEAGKLEFKFLEDAPPPDLTLDYTTDIWMEVPAKISRTPRTELRNSLWAYSQRDYTKTGTLADRYQRAKHLSDLRTFPDELQEDLELDLIQRASTADAVTAYHLVSKKRQRLKIELIAWWNVIGLDQADYVSIANHPILAAHGGSTLVFRVVGKQYLMADEQPGRIRLTLLEVAGTTSATDAGLPNVVITVDEVARGLNGATTGLVRFLQAAQPVVSDLNPYWFDKLGDRWFDSPELATQWFRASGMRIYETEQIDKGRTGPSLIAVTLPARVIENVAWFSDLFGEWFPDRSTDWFDSFGDASATVVLEVNRSDDGVIYAGWEPLVAGQSYSFRFVKVRARVTPASPTASLTIDSLVIALDVPDVVVEILELVIGAGGTVLTFADFGASFVISPTIKVEPLGASAGYRVEVQEVTVTSARLGLRDDQNVLVPGVAKVTLAAY